MRAHGPLVVFSLIVSTLFLSAPAQAQAQEPAPAFPGAPLRDLSWSPDQDARLPVYDDAGELIPFSEIEARVDPSGLRGGFWAGLVGFTAGVLIGEAIGSCGGRRGDFQHYCSPQEEALRDALPAGLGITLGLTGAWIGWEVDVTTWDEALREVRQQRRAGR